MCGLWIPLPLRSTSLFSKARVLLVVETDEVLLKVRVVPRSHAQFIPTKHLHETKKQTD